MKRNTQGRAKTCLALAIAAAGLVLALAWADPPTPAANRKVFTDSVTPLPAQPGLTAHGLNVQAAQPEDKNETMELLFSLPIPKEAQEKLEARVAKGEVLSPKELQGEYSPKAADVEALTKWLKDQGFKITETTADRTSVYAKASVGQIEKSLQVHMVRVTKDGVTYTAAQDAPSLPGDVGAGVGAIIGCQPFRHANKHTIKRIPREGNRRSPKPGDNVANASPAPNIANAPPYLVKEVLQAYNADGMSVTGAGQTIAILIDTFPDDADLQGFWKANQMPTALNHIQKINVNNVQLPTQEGEETLDAEWSSGIAPGATIRIYASGSLEFVDLDKALDRIIADLPGQPGLRQLSISLGLGETYMGGPQGEVAIEHQKFLLLAAAGVNVFVSSGDAGSNPDGTGHSATGPLQVEYESSDPFVIGVGGTTLTLAPSGGVSAESGWLSGGGGKSSLFSRAAYQKGTGVVAGTERLVPDVSLAADPNTGALVFFQGQVQQYGGTSWSAPTWAGFCALMNESRQKANKPPLPFLNPLIYPLIGTPCFRDITTGSNGAFSAGPGYDMVTGIGVPNVKELTTALTQ